MTEKNKSAAKNFFPIFTLILSASFLCIMIVTCAMFNARINDLQSLEREVITVTKYVYIKEDETNDGSISAGKDDIDEENFLVKEYLGQIGIFSLDDGEVKYVIERYTKTLPEADKLLLREGFIVSGTSGIYSVIEDYTG